MLFVFQHLPEPFGEELSDGEAKLKGKHCALLRSQAPAARTAALRGGRAPVHLPSREGLWGVPQAAPPDRVHVGTGQAGLDQTCQDTRSRSTPSLLEQKSLLCTGCCGAGGRIGRRTCPLGLSVCSLAFVNKHMVGESKNKWDGEAEVMG